MSDNQTPNTQKDFQISFWKILLPAVIGIGVVAWMFWSDLKDQNLSSMLKDLHIDMRMILALLAAWIFMFGRDLGLSWRFRTLTDRQLHWWPCFKITFLCEFTSCITPSAVGGSSLGMVFLNREGVEFGRATTLMLTTLFLDELFFVISCPIVILITPAGELFTTGQEGFALGIKYTFTLVYILITLWTAILFMGIIVWPDRIHKFLVKLFSLKWLRRWQNAVDQLGGNMKATSVELRKKKLSWWLEVFGGTALTWTSRYIVVNALFFGFLPQDDPKQWVIFARQFIVWVVLMVSPTPGGSGISEWLFTNYYDNLVPSAGIGLLLALIWRIFTYYVYLAIGAILVPKWLGNTISHFKHKK